MNVNSVKKNSTQPGFGINPKRLISKVKQQISSKAGNVKPVEDDSFSVTKKIITKKPYTEDLQNTLKRFEDEFGKNIFAD